MAYTYMCVSVNTRIACVIDLQREKESLTSPTITKK